VRLDRGLTQQQVSERIGVNRNFVYEMELGHHNHTIYALHKLYLFLGYIPQALKIDETTLQGKFKAYRICTGKTFSLIANEIELDKSTLSRFEKGLPIKKETYSKIENYIKHY
jgi:transcriptional regulator with XRE-family HTH domain